MNPARRATPDSEAVGSSEDERPWPSSTSFGKFPMKENSVPGLPGGIWSNQKRGSFKMSEAAQRNAAREARLGPVNPAQAALRAINTPSPSTSDGANSLPFAIPLQPTPKMGRSLSHSQGQRETPHASGSHTGLGARPPAIPLDLLAEEADTESESDGGNRLTHTTSHPPIGSLMRTATLPASYDHYGHDIDDDPLSPTAQPNPHRGRTFESAFANLSIDQGPRRSQWQSHLGWDDVLNVNESRRHSLADIPTRRGSLAGGESSHLSRVLNHDSLEDEDLEYEAQNRQMNHTIVRRTSREAGGGRDIPTMYRVPHIQLSQQERSELDARREQQQAALSLQPWAHGGNGARPRKQLYIVSFKCSRVDVFYLLDNTGLHIKEGDMVIVEADRGQDLGTVQHAKVAPDAARMYKKKYSEEQYKWLMMYSRNKEGGFNPNAQLHSEGNVGGPLFPDAPSTMQGTIPRDNFNNLKPKAIKRLANEHEIKMLAEKEGNEAKAKRTCQQKVAHLRLQMEILDAEWQWDFQKLIFYYYADHYINFKDLITELYRIYKTRIWLSAINPASFSQHAMGQPPSGIGPGAVGPYNPYAVNSSYTMAYGEDRDPYGAQMPYRIPYDTYTPNYPAIPGVANSFAPGGVPNGNNYMFYGPGTVDPSSALTPTQGNVEDTTPTTEQNPGLQLPGSMMGYNHMYEGMSGAEHQFLPGVQRAPMSPPGQQMPMAFEAGGASFQRPDAHSRRFDAGARGFQARFHPGDNISWGSMPPAASGGRQAGLPNPIGTARPISQGQDTAATNEAWKQLGGNGMFNRDSATSNGNGLRIDHQDSNEAAVSRAQNLNRFFANLPSPDDMHADEMSRER